MANLFDSASLVMIPSGYKAGKLYSIKPTDVTGDFVAARSSIGSRINADGLIENVAADVPRLNYPSCPSVLLEPARTNLITYPVSFDNNYWTDSGALATSGESAPHADYPNDGYLLTETATTEQHYIERNSMTGLTAGSNTFSIVAKPNGRDWIYLRDITSDTARYFDINNGVMGSEVGTVINSSIEAFADGWYRCSITFDVPVATSRFRVNMVTGDGDVPTYLGDGTSGIYIFGAQLEQGTYPTSFIYNGTEGATVDRAVDSAIVSDLIVNGILTATEGTIVDNRDGVSYAYRYTSDGNMESFIDGVSQGSVVAAVPTSYSLVVPSKTEQITMYPVPLTDEEIEQLK